MSYYPMRCDTCGKQEEVCCQFKQLERLTPFCCGARMRQDYKAKFAQPVQVVDENAAYPLWDEGEQRWHQNYRQHASYLKSKGLTWYQQPPENAYRQKHRRDIRAKEIEYIRKHER